MQFGILREIDFAHAAATNQSHDAVVSNRPADLELCSGLGGAGARRDKSRRVEKAADLFLYREKRLDFLEQCRVSRTGLRQERRPLFGGALQRRVKEHCGLL